MNFIWRHRFRPNNSVGVVAYFHYRAHQSPDADAKTAHYHKLFLAVFISELQIKRLGKFGFQAKKYFPLLWIYFPSNPYFRTEGKTALLACDFFVYRHFAFAADIYSVFARFGDSLVFVGIFRKRNRLKRKSNKFFRRFRIG